MWELVILGITSYIGTNLDDLLICAVFYANIDSAKEGKKILVGKYLGMGCLLLISMAGAMGLKLLSPRYIALLGIIPILLGIKEIVVFLRCRSREEAPRERKPKNLAIQLMILTLANGADNIGVYIPLFAGFMWWQMLVIVGIFSLMTALLCYISRKMTSCKLVHRWVERYRHILIPTVYIVLGVYIVIKGQ